MRHHVIDDLRPEPLDIDAGWDEQTLRAIMRADEPAASRASQRWRRPARLAAVAAVAALIVGATYVAGSRVPQDDVRPAAPSRTPVPGSDEAIFAETTKAMATMDEIGPTESTDRTSNAIGTRDFPLGKAPADAYIFFKLGVECADTARYRLGANSEFRGAGVRCEAGDRFTGLSYEFPERVAAGSVNTLSIQVDHPLHYTVTVGYRTTSMYEPKGPSGTLPDGRTYGPMSRKAEEMPDLVSIGEEDGVDRYVEWKQMEGRTPSSPEEALREQRERAQRYRNGERVDRTIPVYDNTGRQIDVHEIMLPRPR